jgi:predicted nucleotidyltransferase
MNTTYKPTYPCKVISSFFDNYYGIHVYETIKSISFRKSKISNQLEKEIFKYFKLFNLIFSIYYDSQISEYLTLYKEVYDENISENVRKLLPQKNDINIQLFIWMNTLLMNFSNLKPQEAYFMFLLSTLLINKQYGYSCVLPVNLVKLYKNIGDNDVKTYFLYSFLNSMFFKEKDDLKNEFIYFMNKNKILINNLGIEELFLFGSVKNNEYHELSDFDLVVRYKKGISYLDIQKTERKLFNLIFDEFKRKSDIQEFNMFIKSHNIIEIEKII